MSRTEALSCVRFIQSFYLQLLYQATEVGLAVMKALNKFRIKLESLVCSLRAHECLLCDRPCALGIRVGHDCSNGRDSSTYTEPLPNTGQAWWAVQGVFCPSVGCACTSVEGCSGQGLGCGSDPVPCDELDCGRCLCSANGAGARGRGGLGEGVCKEPRPQLARL